MLTLGQLKGRAVRQARAHRRLCIVRDCAEAGATKLEAAQRAGMKPGGLEMLLYREYGSTKWPPVRAECAA